MNESRGSRVVVCAPRFLPREKWGKAWKLAGEINPDNLPDPAAVEPPPLASGARAALDLTRYWGKQGVKLTVGFLDSPSKTLRKRILSHLNAWKKTANVRFTETSVDPQVRIARVEDGYWSYLGTDILLAENDRQTMNLEGFTMKTPDEEFRRVIRHEAGHTLGFPHEHMRSQLVARLDRAKTIAYFMKTQDWSEEDVINQVLTPLEESSLIGTAVADQNSIMCYQIPGFLTKDGLPIMGGTDIDPSDHAFAALVYPKQKKSRKKTS